MSISHSPRSTDGTFGDYVPGAPTDEFNFITRAGGRAPLSHVWWRVKHKPNPLETLFGGFLFNNIGEKLWKQIKMVM